MTTAQRQEQQQHLVDVLKDFDTAILVTRTQKGELRGRPMAMADIQPDADVYFATALNHDTVKEIEADPQVAITVQGKLRYASISGRASISRDRALIQRLWKEGWKLWFPEGKDDPNLCLIAFQAAEGEYWDTSGTRGVKFAIKAAKAYLSGERLDGNDKQGNAKVKLA